MPSKVRHVGISESQLSVDQALRLVSGPAVGGIALFVGTVRNSDHGADVVSLDYTQHPSAVDVLTRCAEETADQHDVRAIAVEHRVGHLEVGDVAVEVAFEPVRDVPRVRVHGVRTGERSRVAELRRRVGQPLT